MSFIINTNGTGYSADKRTWAAYKTSLYAAPTKAWCPKNRCFELHCSVGMWNLFFLSLFIFNSQFFQHPVPVFVLLICLPSCERQKISTFLKRSTLKAVHCGQKKKIIPKHILIVDAFCMCLPLPRGKKNYTKPENCSATIRLKGKLCTFHFWPNYCI